MPSSCNLGIGIAFISSSVMVPYGSYGRVRFVQGTRRLDAYAHVDVPWRVGHNHMELAQDGVVKSSQVAIDPLWRKLHPPVSFMPCTQKHTLQTYRLRLHPHRPKPNPQLMQLPLRLRAVLRLPRAVVRVPVDLKVQVAARRLLLAATSCPEPARQCD